MIQWFRPEEFGAGVEHLHPLLILALDSLRGRLGVPIIIHEAYATTGHTPGSQHGEGRAVDCHAEGLPLGDFWLEAERQPSFTGIGLYPYWTHPGLHLDTRPGPQRSRWWKDRDHAYRAVDAASLRTILAA